MVYCTLTHVAIEENAQYIRQSMADSFFSLEENAWLLDFCHTHETKLKVASVYVVIIAVSVKLDTILMYYNRHFHPQSSSPSTRHYTQDLETFLMSLTELDHPNQFSGASVAEINRLPLIMHNRPKQSENKSNSTCEICLEDKSEVGPVRILPCFHQFHAQCVDAWLQINAVCPLCKFNILGSSHHDRGQSCLNDDVDVGDHSLD